MGLSTDLTIRTLAGAESFLSSMKVAPYSFTSAVKNLFS
jgi:hypothetical protein